MGNMTWNHRIVKHSNELQDYYAIHEVYYTDGVPDKMSTEPDQVVAESPEEIIELLEMMLKSAKQSPVFEPPEDWK